MTWNVKQHPNISEWFQEQLNLGIPNGPFGTSVDEPIPGFVKTPSETIFTGGEQYGMLQQGTDHNAIIRLGRDRPGDIDSGAGGLGSTASGMIDLCVGRQALTAAQTSWDEVAKNDHPPNFITDAARVYITQKVNPGIDEYFGLAAERLPSTLYKSAVAAKADCIRLVARDNVRIYAAKVQNAEGLGDEGETDSHGRPIRHGQGKIELIVGNEKHLQPAVLGNKLLEYLEVLEKEFGEVRKGLKILHEQLAVVNGALGVLETFGGGTHFKENLKNNINGIFDSILGELNSTLRGIDRLDKMSVIKGHNSFLSNSVFIS